ncbi:GNAT family N-acetyltransferase [Caldinitratiruptor microaerophilus]|uniref:N-acetyltransferase domain-containing protein n=1 Tax=Caldinitratiruptor microaerophilus TaxID=671077 RepID=A0AA35CHR0_9FIRM|nr:GNAT family N-acetyltransferase [Caldinitratiruptor microaerophilus]BDG59220.1 hypothetical protein caldi_03100 [Caldinitratiruptor microaerophilus]
MAVRVRRLDFARDADRLLAFMPDLYETNFPGFLATPEFLARRRQALREAARDPAQRVLVADDGVRPVGFIWLVLEIDGAGRRRGEVAALYVDPRLRGRGVGRQLMEEGEEVLRGWGCHSAHLMVTVANEAAVRLYRDLGYEVVRYQMEKRLPPAGSAQGGDRRV